MQPSLRQRCLVMAAVTILCLSLSGRAQSPDEAAVKAVVAEFYAAYEKKDVDALMRLWSADSPFYAKVRKEITDQSAATDFAFSNLAVTRLTVDGTRAWLRVAVAVRATHRRTQKTQQDRTLHEIELVREGTEWKFWRNFSAWKSLAEKMLQAESDAARAELLKGEPDLVGKQLAGALIGEGDGLRAQRNNKEAMRAYELARGLADQLQDQKTLYSIWLAIGHAARAQANYDEALQAYNQALKFGGSQKSEAARVQMSIGNVNFQRGNYASALEAYEQAGAAFRELNDQANIAVTLNNVASVNQELGNYASALAAYQQSLAAHEQLKSSPADRAQTLSNIAATYAAQSNFAQALNYLARARELSENADTLHNLGVLYEEQGNQEQALQFLQLSLQRSEASGDKTQQARTLRSLGVVYKSRDESDKALEYYQKSLELSRSLGVLPIIAATHRAIGGLQGQRKDYAAALASFEESLKLSRQSGGRADVAQSLIGLGRVHLTQGDAAQALRCADEAIEIARTIERPDILWRSQELAAKAYLKQGKTGEARRNFDSAIAIVERLRQQVVGGEQESQRFFEDKLGPYRGMVKLLAANDPAAALTYAERAKARVLLDTLQSGRVNVSKAMTAEEQGREVKANNLIFSLNAQIQRERTRPTPDAKRLSSLGVELQKARLDYEDLQTRLYAAHPELKVHRGEAQPVTPQEAGALLPNDQTALLEFAVTDDQSFLFVMTRGAGGAADLKQFPIAVGEKAMAERLRQFRKLLAGRDARYSRPARELYDLLLAPAKPLLQGKTSLVIVPDGALWELPFQALLGPDNRFLLEDAALDYAPSLTVLREMIKVRSKTQTPTATTTLLAFGNPAFGQPPSSQTSAGRPAMPALMDEKLDPLPDAEKQVNSLKGLYGTNRSQVLTGADATEERFKAEAARYGVLHLATHGVLDDHNPMYSYLALAPGAGKAVANDAAITANDDGMLEAWELMKMDLKADLAVLSACETARGRVSAGEGMIGLTWALFVAGVPTTVVSQWKVRSDSTADLMVEFHRRLNTGTGARASKAEALRQAALKLLGDKSSQFRHPFYWAAFVVVGDGI